VPRSLGESEGITDRLAFTVVVQDLEGKDEFRSCLQHEEARKNLLVEPIFNLIVA
jgi:hypothetical protein